MTRLLPAIFTSIQTPTLALALALACGSFVLSAQGSRTRDRTPPTAPTSLVASAVTETSITLTWGPSTDNSGSFTYVICCAGPTVTVGQHVTSHTIEGLKSGQTYTIRVYAKDAAGISRRPATP